MMLLALEKLLLFCITVSIESETVDGWNTREFQRIEEELEEFRRRETPDQLEGPADVRQLLEGIHENLFDPDLTVKTLRARCGLRDNNVSCRFRRQVGRTVKDYIEALRMKAACRLLEESDCPVFDLALSIGYSHPQTFYRAFERAFECTPATYRRQARAEEAAGEG